MTFVVEKSGTNDLNNNRIMHCYVSGIDVDAFQGHVTTTKKTALF